MKTSEQFYTQHSVTLSNVWIWNGKVYLLRTLPKSVNIKSALNSKLNYWKKNWQKIFFLTCLEHSPWPGLESRPLCGHLPAARSFFFYELFAAMLWGIISVPWDPPEDTQILWLSTKKCCLWIQRSAWASQAKNQNFCYKSVCCACFMGSFTCYPCDHSQAFPKDWQSALLIAINWEYKGD